MGRRTKDTEYIEPWSINEEKEALRILYALKLINIHIINNKWVVINGSSNDFMSKLPITHAVHKTIKAEIDESFTLQTINGFSNRKDANTYIKEHYPTLTPVADKDLIVDQSTYYKTLAQVDPDTDQVLAVYQSVNIFIAKNGYSAAQFERNVNTDTIMSGYIWFQALEYDYPITRPDGIFYDPLGKGDTFIKRESNDTRSKRTNGVVTVTAPDGVQTEFNNMNKVAALLDTYNAKISECIENKKLYKGYKIEIKK
jgi:hypothetical protein